MFTDSGKKISPAIVTIKALIEYLFKIEAGEGFKLASFVDSLWNHLEILADWKSMCEILLTDSSSKPFREVKKFLPKNTEEEGILATLLLSCLKRGAGISEMAEVDLKLAALLSKKKACLFPFLSSPSSFCGLKLCCCCCCCFVC